MKLLYHKRKMKKKRMKNKKGISGVITVVIMIALVMVVAVIVWVVVRNIVQGQLGGVESCFGVYDKVTINNMYTCYNPTLNEFQFSINIRGADVDSVIVSISGEGTTKSYTITNVNESISGLGPYPSGSGNVTLPEKDGGLTYIENTFTTKPDLVQIAPTMGGNQCEVSDSLAEIDDCASLA